MANVLIIIILLLVGVWCSLLSAMLETLYLKLYGYRDWKERKLIVVANFEVYLLHIVVFCSEAIAVMSGGLALLFAVAAALAAMFLKGRYYRKYSKGIDDPLRFALLSSTFSSCASLLINFWLLWKMNIVI